MAKANKSRLKADFYHTGEIVLRLARDKRRSWLLFFGSLASIGAITAFLYIQNQNPVSAPAPMAVPAAGPAPAKAEAPRPTSVATPIAAAPAAPAAPVESVNVALQISSSKPGPLWLDGKPMGVVKKAMGISVAPGPHELKMRFGRKFISETVQVPAGTALSVRFDARKRKVLVKGP